jgi:hypothetical protein
MRMMTRTSLTLSLALTTIALTQPARAQDSSKVQRPTSELITREQIVEAKANNLHQVIEQLHSNWLVSRMPAPGNRANVKVDTSGRAQYTTDVLPGGRSNPGENGGIQVYLDGNRVGGIDELKSIRAGDVYSIRRINGVDAQARFGIGHGSGVIFVSTVSSQSKP